MVLWLLACAFTGRVEKSLLAADYMTPVTPVGEAATVVYDTGVKGDEPQRYEPTIREVEGRQFYEVPEITSAGWIEVAPTAESTAIRLYVRSGSLNRHDFVPVRSLTGALDNELRNEVRFVPEHTSAPLHLSMRQLGNVYNEYDLGHGDLVLVEVGDEGAEPERYLFKLYEFGPRFKYSGGLLLTVPLGSVVGTMPESTSAVVAFTTSFAYRFRTRSPVLRWFGGNSAFIISTGVGSTALSASQFDAPIEDVVTAHVASIIAGGGFEFYDFVSVQALVNLSALDGDLAQAPWVLSVGFDTVRFGFFMRDLGTRLFRRNALD